MCVLVDMFGVKTLQATYVCVLVDMFGVKLYKLHVCVLVDVFCVKLSLHLRGMHTVNHI